VKAEGYTLDLYCDADPCVREDIPGCDRASASYFGENKTQVWRDARADGWKSWPHPLNQIQTCPACTKQKRKRK
jgi:hypothetical protein